MERNRTTRVNLVEHSWERDNARDSLSKQTLPEDEEDESNIDSSDSSNSDGPPEDWHTSQNDKLRSNERNQNQSIGKEGTRSHACKNHKRKLGLFQPKSSQNQNKKQKTTNDTRIKNNTWNKEKIKGRRKINRINHRGRKSTSIQCKGLLM